MYVCNDISDVFQKPKNTGRQTEGHKNIVQSTTIVSDNCKKKFNLSKKKILIELKPKRNVKN